ncbi:hypothetical protein BHU24_05030 [Bacillus pseudomycoides]|uniref:AuaD protein n=1 Tax=Bacillus pseudomycoides TaxID=64104 RepID=A0AAJ2DMV0_9BACI|nr:beta-ketoacyl synthase N-terminal-like domain-containing protein [Bacillus pseudomycoides]MBD5797253.1 hypothetical protein [Bacillus pseudomycoides]MDR4329679.1 AuaD protein [Bacillus pseudomycoides]MED1477507.1 beta-ketoacyl synthase N-terminal-like domain-containing protein [Bacillus pseudomycoides]MED1538483.1 beta-ketoacyl synthase N-terminal-like domain-containing protein [Bacillus pseudomycoides]PEO84207.1 AuaD protein [Bacillus pseudomycoides]
MKNSENRIVVTGVGTVSAYGTDDKALWKAIRDGDSSLCHKNLNQLESPQAVRVNNFRASELLGKKGLRFMHPSSLFLSAASILALRDASIDVGTIDADKLGIVVSTNFAGFKMSAQYDQTTITEGPRYVSPMESPNTIANSPASYLAIRIQSRAFNTTISSGSCAGLDALGYAMSMLKNKKADTVVVGGTEEWNDEINWYYKKAGLLPKKHFEQAGKIFDLQSSGVLPGEGSVAVVLERLDVALKRGANIMGELDSWNSCFASSANKDTRIRGFIRCMDNVIQKSNITKENVDFIVSGANGLPEQDEIELAALNKMFDYNQTPIFGLKRIIGETSGANGLFQLFTSLHAIQNGVIPSSAIYNNSHNQRKNIDNVLLTANDIFGGISSMIVKKLI